MARARQHQLSTPLADTNTLSSYPRDPYSPRCYDHHLLSPSIRSTPTLTLDTLNSDSHPHDAQHSPSIRSTHTLTLNTLNTYSHSQYAQHTFSYIIRSTPTLILKTLNTHPPPLHSQHSLITSSLYSLNLTPRKHNSITVTHPNLIP